MDFEFSGRHSATRLDGIASPMLHRRYQTFPRESKSDSPLMCSSPELIRSHGSTARILRRPDSPRPRSLDVLLPEMTFRRSLPNLTVIEDVEGSSPSTLSPHFEQETRPRNSWRTLSVDRPEHARSLKSRSTTSIHLPGSPVGRVRAGSDATRSKALLTVKSSSLMNQHGKPISRSWSQLHRSENDSSSN